MFRLIAPLVLVTGLAALVNIVALTAPSDGRDETSASIRTGLCLTNGIGCGGPR